MEDQKFCDQCDHYIKKLFFKPSCTHPHAKREVKELITKSNYPLCLYERKYGNCGMEGVNFEPKRT